MSDSQTVANASQTIATWVGAIGTIVVAFVAVLGQSIRDRIYAPRFKVTSKGAPPDCVAVPFTTPEGSHLCDSYYLRLWVENVGKAAAKNTEVFAKELRKKRADNKWEQVSSFPSMNLKWSNLGTIYFPSIAREMGKWCDLGHVVDPKKRHLLREDSPRLGLTDQQTSMAFDLMVAPNHRGHIIGPGEYQLDIVVAAENARPTVRTVTLHIRGQWLADETEMFRDGLGLDVAG